MTPLDTRCLEAFSGWLGGFAEEARALCNILERQESPEALKWASAQSLNYLIRSLDLIPEGIEDLGYLDDLFAFRIIAHQTAERSPDLSLQDESGTLAKLAADAELVAEFLPDDYSRLRESLQSLGEAETRGRSARDLVDDPQARGDAVAEVRSWADTYQAPALEAGDNELVKLRAFLKTKLPQPS
jgi:uncharacterized membrane protein YkvA (DUF1232 family)